MKILTVAVLCFDGSRPIYGVWHVENMHRMLRKHLTVPFRFVVVTNRVQAMRAAGFEAVEIWPSPRFEVSPTHWLHNYVRLGLFDGELGRRVGERILSLDLDAVIRSNIDHLVTDPAPFRIMSLKKRTQLQGGLFLIEPGSLTPNPWARIHEPDAYEFVMRSRRYVGSDQAVLSELFYEAVQRGEIPTFNESHGVSINDYFEPWALFFRTGARKCWHPARPEYGEYYMQTGRPIGEVPPEGISSAPETVRRHALLRAKLDARLAQP